MAFSETLRQLLSVKNMKAVDLSRQTGLSEASISDYLSGKKEPRGRQSVEIARALGVTLDLLWETGFDKKSPAPESEADMQKAKLIKLYDGLSQPGKSQLISHAEYLANLEAGQEPRKMAVAAHKGGILFKDAPDEEALKREIDKLI